LIGISFIGDLLRVEIKKNDSEGNII